MKKPFYLSKTLWVSFIALVALAIQTQTGWVVPPEYQIALLGGIEFALRFFTKQAIV